MTDSIIGLIRSGLVGGFIARGLRQAYSDTRIMAYMRARSKLEQARAGGVVDVILDEIGEKLRECSLIFLCTPVGYNVQYLSAIRPFLKPGALVTDVGSMKTDIHKQVVRLGMEDCSVDGHPMTGSERTGYENSTGHLLENTYYIITPTAASTDSQVERLMAVAKAIGSILMMLDYKKHDFITVAVNHLPHVIVSNLMNLVKDSDNEEEMMKRLTAGGFKDITRIVSSSPEMWEQICMTNRESLAVILERYIVSLSQILGEVKGRDKTAFHELFETPKDHRDPVSERAKGSVSSDYFFTVGVVGEPGSISTLSVILASKGVSIRNIGINHDRERGEGVLGINFYDEESVNRAWEQLEKYHYDVVRSS